ncbi:response regulator [Lachnospiraceae bacterium]|nr:response regulator [Lachnospiraceae bacterium]
MKKILLIDDSDTYTWCLQKYLQHRGYPVKTACTLKEARAAIQEEMPLVVCCNLDLPDGSGMDFLDEVRAADKELPFILASCHDKDDYEQEAMRRGAMLCMDKMKGLLLQDKLVEYAYRQLSGEPDSTFHKLLFVHAEDTSAGALQAAMLQKGLDLILVSSIADAKCRIFEDEEIELILCDLELPDGTAMELFHTLRRVAGMFQMKNPPVRLLPFFILTENNDLATEYEYRHEGINDYFMSPVNIPELIRRIMYFVEDSK